MKARKRSYSGTTDNTISERELRGRATSREAAAEGMVLLKNDGLLPLRAGARIALFGGGAVCTVKGGTGSGDVNEREVVSIYQGLADAGFEITSREWLDSYGGIYRNERERWRDEILNEMREKGETRLLRVYSEHVFHMPEGNELKDRYFENAEAAFYVISRTAGEDADRFERPGDYYLTEEEKRDLRRIADHCENVGVIINSGGQIDVQEILGTEHVKALLYISQPGMEGGHALADLLTGAVSPSGKLTDTWARQYADFPNSATFSHNNGDVQKEYYKEGIYVGYRYFDSFKVAAAYPFGFGLSYTTFSVETESMETGKNTVRISANVKNTGDTFAGKEVVQVYVSCPQTELQKEFRRLCGFAKTGILRPQETEKVTVVVTAKDMASFDERRSAWILEQGLYGIWVGTSLQDAVLSGALCVEEEVILERVKPICPLQEALEELVWPQEDRMRRQAAWHAQLQARGIVPAVFRPEILNGREEQDAGSETFQKSPLDEAKQAAVELTGKLSEEQLIAMVIGEVSKGQGQTLGAAGIMVPGAAGETSGALEAGYGVPGVSMADGPAGLRLMKEYEVDQATGEVYNQGILGALEGGFFAGKEKHENAQTRYQYCTAIPVGTLLAQTWNTDLLGRVGRTVAAEMEEFHVSWWLAPGMNIHRNPLCGRNFEYYSEDPYLSGHMAAAITRGVQSLPGTGTTIKHFACNNQEDNRKHSDSILSERALRELYLRGFEIAVKTSQPMAIMTSYNLVNGVHAANSRDLCTQAARKEWGFAGIIMTDWTTTMPDGGSTPWRCILAGNDLIMPGYDGDFRSIREALDSGKLAGEDLRACVIRMLTVIFQTNAFEQADCYGKQFSFSAE